MTARYAIYYAPERDSALHRDASAWLGRDAFSGERVARPGYLERANCEDLTDDPRGYGFHATLRAPFELAADSSEPELLHFAEAFASAQPAFDASISVNALGRFIAFTLSEPSAPMQALHEACVRDFEPFRAPIGAFDIERRRRANLTPDQDAYLLSFGYPYVFEYFRFHMTLTSAIKDEGAREDLRTTLRDAFAQHCARIDFRPFLCSSSPNAEPISKFCPSSRLGPESCVSPSSAHPARARARLRRDFLRRPASTALNSIS